MNRFNLAPSSDLSALRWRLESLADQRCGILGGNVGVSEHLCLRTVTTGSWVYFIRCGARGPVKIGVARDIPQRLATLQVANPERLTLEAFIPGGEHLEATLHEALRAHHIRGEWFRACDDVDCIVFQAMRQSRHIQQLVRASEGQTRATSEARDG